jgi:hypothetical protein
MTGRRQSDENIMEAGFSGGRVVERYLGQLPTRQRALKINSALWEEIV